MSQYSIDNTYWLLEQWGRWARVDTGLALRYPSVEQFTQLLGINSPSPLINDDEAMMVDRIISKLNHRNRDMGEVVVMYYLMNRNLSRVASYLKMNKRRADNLVQSGTAWVDGALNMSKAA